MDPNISTSQRLDILGEEYVAFARGSLMDPIDEADQVLARFKQHLLTPTEMNIQTGTALERLHKLNGAKVDPKTGKVTIDDRDYQRKYSLISRLRIDAKTGYIYANDKDFQAKKDRIIDVRFNPKTQRIEDDDGPALKAIDRVNKAAVHDKSVTVRADTTFFNAVWRELMEIPDITKRVIIETEYRKKAGTGSAYSGQTARAGGGPVYAGEGYTVGEMGAEAFYPAIDGRILSRADAMRALSASVPTAASATTRAYADDTININAGNPYEVARLVDRQLRYRDASKRLQGGGSGL